MASGSRSAPSSSISPCAAASVPIPVAVGFNLVMVGSLAAYWGNTYISTDATALASGGLAALLTMQAIDGGAAIAAAPPRGGGAGHLVQAAELHRVRRSGARARARRGVRRLASGWRSEVPGAHVPHRPPHPLCCGDPRRRDRRPGLLDRAAVGAGGRRAAQVRLRRAARGQEPGRGAGQLPAGPRRWRAGALCDRLSHAARVHRRHRASRSGAPSALRCPPDCRRCAASSEPAPCWWRWWLPPPWRSSWASSRTSTSRYRAATRTRCCHGRCCRPPCSSAGLARGCATPSSRLGVVTWGLALMMGEA